MTRWRVPRSRRIWQNKEWPLVRQLCEDHASSKAGLYSGLGTASLYEMPIKSSGWSTHSESWRVATLSTPWFSAMSALFLLRITSARYWKFDELTKRKPKPKHPQGSRLGRDRQTWCHRDLHLWWHHGCWSILQHPRDHACSIHQRKTSWSPVYAR